MVEAFCVNFVCISSLNIEKKVFYECVFCIDKTKYLAFSGFKDLAVLFLLIKTSGLHFEPKIYKK